VILFYGLWSRKVACRYGTIWVDMDDDRIDMSGKFMSSFVDEK
jgi:hypothetical protein